MSTVTPVSFDDNNQLWLGVPNISKDMLKRFDPAYTGNVHIFVVKTPPIFEQWYKTTHWWSFKVAMERCSTSLTGLPDLSLNYQDQSQGFSDRKIPHATNSTFDFDQVSVRCLEFKGLPIYTMMRDWIENISDPITKVKDYQGRAKDIAGGYSLANHSASIIVCNADPTNTQIQGRAHYITAMQPVSINNNHYEWNNGEMGIVEGFDLSFRGILRWGDTIDNMAASLLAQRKLVTNYYAKDTTSLNWYAKETTVS